MKSGHEDIANPDASQVVMHQENAGGNREDEGEADAGDGIMWIS